jgi:hypothetical protein
MRVVTKRATMRITTYPKWLGLDPTRIDPTGSATTIMIQIQFKSFTDNVNRPTNASKDEWVS